MTPTPEDARPLVPRPRSASALPADGRHSGAPGLHRFDFGLFDFGYWTILHYSPTSPPRSKKFRQIGGIHVTIAIEVRCTATARAPTRQQFRQVRGVDVAVAVEVSGAAVSYPLLKLVGAHVDDRTVAAERDAPIDSA